MSEILLKADDVANLIRLFATSLSGKITGLETELNNRFSNAVWISSTAPPIPSQHITWLKVTAEDTDLLFNYGTDLNPIWISPIKTIKVPGTYGQPYATNERVDGNVVWAVRLNFGALPNATTKSIIVPTAVTSVWSTQRWFDVSNCRASDSNGNVVPLPNVGYAFQNGTSGKIISDNITLSLVGNLVQIQTDTDRTSYNAIVTIKYLKGA